jgi:hypothetical protein
MDPEHERHARELLAQELAGILKQLRSVEAAARDRHGESFGLLVARIGEVQDRLAWLVEKARLMIAEGQ